eukprot:m.836286 g.836286  ORF g.836286 m.836286 type:complete len:1147 (-) comp59483_c0_seq3:50-3490(-)
MRGERIVRPRLQPTPPGAFESNAVRTSKYRWYDFVVKNLFEQFRRIANVYFLALVVLNWIPQLNVFGKQISMLPLVFVLSVTMIKDGYEDYRRKRSDNELNAKTCRVLRTATSSLDLPCSVVPTPWAEVCVGDLVVLERDEQVPADLVVLASSGDQGVCYMSSMNLDGESNLKLRRAILLQETRQSPIEQIEILRTIAADLAELQLVCEAPTRRIDSFVGRFEASLTTTTLPEEVSMSTPLVTSARTYGTLQIPKANYSASRHVSVSSETDSIRSLSQRVISADVKNTLLRGCVLRNTAWAVGMVAYAGHQTKAMLNTIPPPAKRSALEKRMNGDVLVLIGFLFALCLGSAIGAGAWIASSNHQDAPFYTVLSTDGSPPFTAFILFWSFVIVFQVMVPIALYVSMEFVKGGQAYFIAQDLQLYDESSDTPAVCRALNIAEDLGQVSHIFSDKTGTLTENIMQYRRCSIRGHEIDPTVSHSPLGVTSLESESELAFFTHLFYLTLALCNTVVPTRPTDGNEIRYEGESRDEVALVEAAQAAGFILISRSTNEAVVSIHGEEHSFHIHCVNEFDSDRRRMSMVISYSFSLSGQSSSTGQFIDRLRASPFWLLCKGADSAVLPLDATTPRAIQTLFEAQVSSFASNGFRTLCVACRPVDAQLMQDFSRTHKLAVVAGEDRAELFRRAAESVENTLISLGITAIEDKLARAVPETIQTLMQTGIRMWMLTGDKQETAMSIAVSCGLVPSGSRMILLSGLTEDACRRELSEHLVQRLFAAQTSPANGSAQLSAAETTRSVAVGSSSLSVAAVSRQQVTEPSASRKFAIVVSGTALHVLLSDTLRPSFMELADSAVSVICFRSSPVEKALVVQAVKRTNPRKVTLAIGDGANDVAMLQAAHVGIGIVGREGSQAAMSSDFAIGSFRFLTPLLLVHGHWCLSRLARFCVYFCYKNAVFVFLLFFFQIYCGFSTQSAIDDVNLILFSLLFTGVPVIINGLFDQRVPREALLTHASLYRTGVEERLYNKRIFWATMADTLWQALCLFYVPYLALHDQDIGLFELGSIFTTASVVVVNLHLGVDTHCWTAVQHACLWGSIIIYFLFQLVYSAMPLTVDYYAFYNASSRTVNWLTILLTVVLALSPRFMMRLMNVRV